MEKLVLKETKHSPLVVLDPQTGVFELKGSSFLDNAHEFYTPIIEWLKEYAKTPAPNTKILFDLNYINTSSQRMVFDLLKRVNLMFKAGSHLSIEWLYDENDFDLRDVGEDLLSFMDFPYKIIEKVS
jgi:hypothetical protein